MKIFISVILLFLFLLSTPVHAQQLMPTNITPTVYCLGNCPTDPSTTPISAPVTVGPTQPVSPTSQSTSATPGPTINPCSAENSASIMHHKEKHKKKFRENNGGGAIERFLQFLAKLIEMFLKLIGGSPLPPGGNTPTPIPTQGGQNQPTSGPVPTTNPCNPTAAPTVAIVTPSIGPSVVLPTQTTTLPSPTNPPSATACSNPIWQSSAPNGMYETNGYFVHNNMWNTESNPGPQTTYVCGYNNWYVTSNQTNSQGAVKTYPNAHKDFNNLNGTPFNNFTTITSTFAATAPRVGIYNVAYDLWLNGVGWGNGTEYMIWTENFGQRPLGNKQETVTFGGQSYDAYYYNSGGANVVSLVATSTMTSGTLNLKEMITWAIGKGWISANPTINQIGFGVEIVSTNGTNQTFKFTNFSVTAN